MYVTLYICHLRRSHHYHGYLGNYSLSLATPSHQKCLTPCMWVVGQQIAVLVIKHRPYTSGTMDGQTVILHENGDKPTVVGENF